MTSRKKVPLTKSFRFCPTTTFSGAIRRALMRDILIPKGVVHDHK